MDAALVMFKSDGSRREFPLTKSRIVIGRTSNCDLRIPLSSVSRQHCELRREEDAFILRDLGSSNGTFHNHSRIQEIALQAGDEIVIGPVIFTLVVDNEPQITQPVRTIIEGSADSAAALVHDDHKTDVPGSSTIIQTETVDYDDPFTALEAMARREEEETN